MFEQNFTIYSDLPWTSVTYLPEHSQVRLASQQPTAHISKELFEKSPAVLLHIDMISAE